MRCKHCDSPKRDAYACRVCSHARLMVRRTAALTAYVQADHAHRAASARYGATLLRLAPLSSYDREVLLAQRDRERAASAMAFHRAATRLHRQEHPIAREDEARAVRAYKQAAATAQALLDAPPRAPRKP